MTRSMEAQLAGGLCLSDIKLLLSSLQDDTLTVLCYHRIGNTDNNRFHGYRPNFSASPASFALQMRIIKKLFNPISLQDLVLWIESGRQLPKRPVLVTFDDGYRDNGVVAWPIMRQLGIPGVVFVATDYIGTGKPFLWDYAAYCFEMTRSKRSSIPLLGERTLFTPLDRHAATSEWVAASKQNPARDRWRSADALATALDVSPPPEVFSQLCLDWETIRRLSKDGLEFGGHTKTHPILSKLSVPEAKEEIARCQACLRNELGRPASGFAYPNGSAQDFSSDHENAVRDAGFQLGFSLQPGPTKLFEVRQNSMAVRRLYVGKQDSLARFLLKLTGAARVKQNWEQNRG